MAQIIEIANPFNKRDTRTTVHPGGVSIRAFLAELYGPLFEDFARPTICTVNGKPLLRAEWGKYKIKQKDVIHFRTFPGYAVPIAYWIIALVTIASVVVALSQNIPSPGIPGATPEPDSVFDLKGQRNQIRLGNPIENPYGKNRLWPSYAARPYNKFINNDQYQYQLFCLGHGYYDIEKKQIEDTLLENFQDVECEVYEPGDSVTLFPDNVQTSTEVGGIELFGPNQTEFTGAAGPFAANDAGTQTTKLEVDVSLPVGLYLADKASGVLSSQYIGVDFQYREIDDDGDPVGGGDWLTLEFFEREFATNTPQRYTLEKSVPAGRYEVQATRANNKNLDTKAGNVARWDALRAFMPSTKDYGQVTLIALKARASNNLNDRASNRFNVVATRKLRTRVSGAWTGLVATRSITAAFCDIFQANYGGRLEDAYLALSDLETLQAIYTAKGWNFDFVFDQRSTVWDCAKVIARCGRAVPMLEGSRVTMIRDYAKTVPTAVFNQENIVQNSFRWDVKLVNIDEFDGLEVEYTDPDTFLPETVECLVGDDAGDNLEQIKFPGCTDRTHAFREGMYMRASKLLLVENITFQTGLEGHIPAYGDLIQVVHDLPKWGSGGLLQSIGIDFKTLQLNEPVTFGAGTHKIAFRKKNGDTAGPYTVTAGSNAKEVVLAVTIDPTNYFFDNLHELPLFIFGPENLNGTLCTVVGLTPSDQDNVEVEAVVYDPNVFAADEDAPPALPPSKMPDPVPDIPALNCASVRAVLDPIEENKTRVSWSPAYGATSYNVERSADGTTWVLAGSTAQSYLDIVTTPGEVLYIRVQPVGKGSGAYCSMAGAPGPGGGGPIPPPGPTEYPDLFPSPVIPGGISVSFECRTRGGTAELKGYSEYAASVPPKKFLTKTLSGGLQWCYWQNDGVTCVGLTIGSFKYDYSGACNFNPVTEVESGTGNVRLTPGNSSCAYVGTPADSPSCGLTGTPGSPGPDLTETLASTQWKLVGTGACATDLYRVATGSAQIDLTNEDSEEAAMQRLDDTLDPWGAFGSCTGTEAYWTQRGAGEFTFDYLRAQFRVFGQFIFASVSFQIHVNIQTSLIGSGIWSDAGSFVVDVDAGTSGEFDTTFELPLTKGYATRANGYVVGL